MRSDDHARATGADRRARRYILLLRGGAARYTAGRIRTLGRDRLRRGQHDAMRAAALAVSALVACANAQSAWEAPNSKHWKYATDIRDASTYVRIPMQFLTIRIRYPQLLRRSLRSIAAAVHPAVTPQSQCERPCLPRVPTQLTPFALRTPPASQARQDDRRGGSERQDVVRSVYCVGWLRLMSQAVPGME